MGRGEEGGDEGGGGGGSVSSSPVHPLINQDGQTWSPPGQLSLLPGKCHPRSMLLVIFMSWTPLPPPPPHSKPSPVFPPPPPPPPSSLQSFATPDPHTPPSVHIFHHRHHHPLSLPAFHISPCLSRGVVCAAGGMVKAELDWVSLVCTETALVA